jgi:hypothetical protein
VPLCVRNLEEKSNGVRTLQQMNEIFFVCYTERR